MHKFFIEPTEFSDEEIKVFYKTIVNKVKKLRDKKGVSQLELALAISFKSVSSVVKPEILIDNKHSNLEHLYKIAKVLGVEIRYFLNNL
ncbi:MAG: helix-turn-helix domain-containing protein [Campylobacteraceae bacterium]|nr:helix-turn-helix domain-containing protein [Campylobacteraceae bacterium]